MRGVILYGPPASGKSTITRLLEETGEFALFQRLKVGPGRSDEYRITDSEDLGRRRAAGDLLWENERYGATYAVDRSGLDEALVARTVAVLHLGQPEAVDAIQSAYPNDTWVVVQLWADQIETESRLKRRGDLDRGDRLNAWAESMPLRGADLSLDTTHVSPRTIVEKVQITLPGLPNV